MRMNLRRSLPSPTREFLKEANRRRSTVSAGQHRIRAELAKLDRQIGNLVDGVAAGADALALNVRIKTLEAERSALADTSTDDLERGLAFVEERGSSPLLHPNLAKVYRDKVEDLSAALHQTADQSARDAFGPRTRAGGGRRPATRRRFSSRRSCERRRPEPRRTGSWCDAGFRRSACRSEHGLACAR